MNLWFELIGRRLRERRGVWIAPKEGRSNAIHPGVGRLRRENGCDEQLIRVFVLELRVGVWMLALKFAENRACALMS